MDHSSSRCLYFSFMVLLICGRIVEDGMGFKQHFAGQWVSDSRALLFSSELCSGLTYC
jgi:hypothetical protein